MSAEGIKVDQRKVQAIREWPVPGSCAEVRRFCGLVNYYWHFVPTYLEVAAPLTALCSPAAQWRWGTQEVMSFIALRELLSGAPVLRTFNQTRQQCVTTDASQTAITVTLTQVDTEGNHWPVEFESRSLTAAEQTYPAHNLELLEVVHALSMWRHYLLGSGAQWLPGDLTGGTICTDNQAVTWLRSKKDLSLLHARWLDDLAEFSFDVVHVPGHSNPADQLTSCGLPSPAPSTGETDQESQQKLFSGLGRDSVAVQELRQITTAQRTVSATAAMGVAPTQSVAATPPADTLSATPAFIPLAGATLCTATGVMACPPTAAAEGLSFLSPTFTSVWSTHVETDPFFGPIYRGASSTLGAAVDAHGRPVTPAATGGLHHQVLAFVLKGARGRGPVVCTGRGRVAGAGLVRVSLGGYFGS